MARNPLAQTAVDDCRRYYGVFGIPEAADLGIARLEAGFAKYGDDGFVLHSEAGWLTEALEELLDAFNMLTGMRSARREVGIAGTYIAGAIRAVLEERSRASIAPSAVPALDGSSEARAARPELPSDTRGLGPVAPAERETESRDVPAPQPAPQPAKQEPMP